MPGLFLFPLCRHTELRNCLAGVGYAPETPFPTDSVTRQDSAVFSTEKRWSRFLFACSPAARATHPEPPGTMPAGQRWMLFVTPDSWASAIPVAQNILAAGEGRGLHNVLLQAGPHGQKLAASGPAARGRVLFAAAPEDLAKNPLRFSVEKTSKLICFTPG